MLFRSARHTLRIAASLGAPELETELECDVKQRCEHRECQRDQNEIRDADPFRSNEEFGKIQRDIVEAIRQVAKDQKYDLVLGEGVIYASKAVDITESVIKYLKK